MKIELRIYLIIFTSKCCVESIYIFMPINSRAPSHTKYKKIEFVRKKEIVMEYPSILKLFFFMMSYLILKEIFRRKDFCINNAKGPKKRWLFLVEYHESLL